MLAAAQQGLALQVAEPSPTAATSSVVRPSQRPKELGVSVEAYVFVTTTNPGPRKACQAIRRLPGVVRADALFGTPDVVAIVTGDDLASMDAVIDRIVELAEVTGTDSKVVRWIK
jgi:hypothetical protein